MTTPAPVFEAARRRRSPLTIDLAEGVIQAGGHRARFDPAADDAIELAYLRLVRRMRDVHREPSFVLRSDDVEALAAVLRRDAVTVLERLGELMGATVTQRRSMVTAFLAGALLIAVATGAVALGSDDGAAPTPSAPLAGEELAPEADGPSTRDRADSEARDDVPIEDTARGARADAVTPAPSTAVGPSTTSAPRAATSTPRAEEDRTTAPREPRPAPVAPSSGGAQGGVERAVPARPSTPVRSPAPAPPPDAPPVVDGAPDAWTWDDPEVDQPGAIIDIPPDPEVVQPGASIDLPGDDPATGAA